MDLAAGIRPFSTATTSTTCTALIIMGCIRITRCTPFVCPHVAGCDRGFAAGVRGRVPAGVVVERGRVAQTFLDWPADQAFLTPSFTGNGFGATDLNAVPARPAEAS
jgi:hypothetical protein